MWQKPQFPADLVKFSEEIFNGKLYFLCSVSNYLSILNKSIEHWKRLESSFAVLVVDFNARSKPCYPDDIKSMEDTHLDSLGWTDGLHQLILEPRYILPNFSSCVYLIFTDETSLTPADIVLLSIFRWKLSSSNNLCYIHSFDGASPTILKTSLKF